uniref:Dipeptide epimerase n=1 Tax=candidate division WOR-3 bacterium TaxID=2052148 RepID=A0A7V4E4X1_UNCW3
MAKITKITLEKKIYEYDKPFHITGSVSTASTNIEIVVETEEGIKGYGEASPSFRVNGEKPEALLAMESFVSENLRFIDTDRWREIFDFTDKLIATPSLKAAIQWAVISIFCTEHGISPFEFFGGLKREIETDKTVGIDTLENRVKEAEAIFSEGFRVIKIKVGENLEEDIEAVLRIREKTRGATYIIDANMGYTPKQAIDFANILYREGVDVAVFEQPVHYQDLDGLKFVRFRSPFPVAADESAKTKFDVYRLLKNDVVDYVNIKLMKSGISDAMAIIEMARSSGLRLMIGCMGESSLGINQSVMFALGTGAFDFHDLDSHLLIKEETFRGNFRQAGPKITLL